MGSTGHLQNVQALAQPGQVSTRYPLVKLPHPYLTVYEVHSVADTAPAKYNLRLKNQPKNGQAFPEALHNESLFWLEPTLPAAASQPPTSDNTPWGRARRSPVTSFEWKSHAPSLGQIWNVIHAIFIAHPTIETFRLTLAGDDADIVRSELLVTGLGVAHPEVEPFKIATGLDATKSFNDEILILRSAFWQGAASPAGPRPIWAVGIGSDGPLRQPLAQYPPMPEGYKVTNRFPNEPVYTRHPTRRPKPFPGSIVYSRYIPEVDEHFSLEAVDWEDNEHVALFNKWQNDPRVAAGWNETGTMDEHREYLRKLHFDPHVLCLFGRFDDSRFSYYELYWSKVTHS